MKRPTGTKDSPCIRVNFSACFIPSPSDSRSSFSMELSWKWHSPRSLACRTASDSLCTPYKLSGATKAENYLGTQRTCNCCSKSPALATLMGRTKELAVKVGVEETWEKSVRC
eukprot:TRINITY_DN5242_c0_g1_i8.p2 TRINITY_DN5242_c0_g1~~TRINITY_DN5242_c0_g1_i8.p2  ORF type:complete len:113 (-),score=4.32 TRINITY_DN5242_c0_g1_i8:228-566(-)